MEAAAGVHQRNESKVVEEDFLKPSFMWLAPAFHHAPRSFVAERHTRSSFNPVSTAHEPGCRDCFHCPKACAPAPGPFPPARPRLRRRWFNALLSAAANSRCVTSKGLQNPRMQKPCHSPYASHNRSVARNIEVNFSPQLLAPLPVPPIHRPVISYAYHDAHERWSNRTARTRCDLHRYAQELHVRQTQIDALLFDLRARNASVTALNNSTSGHWLAIQSADLLRGRAKRYVRKGALKPCKNSNQPGVLHARKANRLGMGGRLVSRV